MKHFLGIVALGVIAAIVYGIIHDQITARICVEYFTIGHAPVFNSDDPTLLGLGWGVLATWWVGLLLGLPLAVMARIGNLPKRSAGSLVRPIVRLMAITAACAFASGIVGWLLARNGTVFLMNDLHDRVPSEKHVAYLACLWAHSASYLVGFVCGLTLIVRVGVWRYRAARS
jgi:hypothetical protein